MPMDPDVRAFLDQQAALAMPPMTAIPVAEARARMEAETPFLGEPADVARVDDLSVPSADGPIPVRVYAPAGGGLRAGVMFFHGGGWVVGSVASHDGVCRLLANAADAVVVSVEYRMAPEHRFPAAADDCFAATQWVAANAAKLGIDATRLAVCGDSAGGNLATVMTLMARDRGGPAIASQLLIYPVTDYDINTPSYLENAEGCGLTRETMAWLWKEYAPTPEAQCHPYASPLRATDLSGLPPALVLTAEYDILRDEAEVYAERLRGAGVPVRLVRYDGQIHGFIRRGNTMPRAYDAIEELAAAVREMASVTSAR